MIIRNVTLADLQQATRETPGVRMEAVNVSTSRTRQFRVRLYPVGDSRRAYRLKLDGSPRRVNGCSWLAFRDWFRALYSRQPNADCSGGLAFGFRYRNREAFERLHQDTGNLNLGTRYRPILAADNQWPGPDGSE